MHGVKLLRCFPKSTSGKEKNHQPSGFFAGWGAPDCLGIFSFDLRGRGVGLAAAWLVWIFWTLPVERRGKDLKQRELGAPVLIVTIGIQNYRLPILRPTFVVTRSTWKGQAPLAVVILCNIFAPRRE